MSSCSALGLQTQPDWISQVPQLFFLHALPAFTPTGQLDARADYFSSRAGFTISGRLTTCKLCIEADFSSPFRIAAHGFAVQLLKTFASLIQRPTSLPALCYRHATGRSYMSNQQLT